MHAQGAQRRPSEHSPSTGVPCAGMMACILTLTPTRWYRDVRGDVGYTDGLGLTLFHGHRKHRQYSARYDVLKQMRFDPAADVALQNQSGVWMWASDKPELHEAVRIYVGYISVYPCPVAYERSCSQLRNGVLHTSGPFYIRRRQTVFSPVHSVAHELRRLQSRVAQFAF